MKRVNAFLMTLLVAILLAVEVSNADTQSINDYQYLRLRAEVGNVTHYFLGGVNQNELNGKYLRWYNCFPVFGIDWKPGLSEAGTVDIYFSLDDEICIERYLGGKFIIEEICVENCDEGDHKNGVKIKEALSAFSSTGFTIYFYAENQKNDHRIVSNTLIFHDGSLESDESSIVDDEDNRIRIELVKEIESGMVIMEKDVKYVHSGNQVFNKRGYFKMVREILSGK